MCILDGGEVERTAWNQSLMEWQLASILNSIQKYFFGERMLIPRCSPASKSGHLSHYERLLKARL